MSASHLFSWPARRSTAAFQGWSADLDAALRTPVALAAVAVLVAAVAVLVMAATAEVLRLAGRAGRVVGLLDRLTPRPVRRAAAGALAALVLLAGPSATAAAGRAPGGGRAASGSGDPPVVADRDSLDRRTTRPAVAVRDGRARADAPGASRPPTPGSPRPAGPATDPAGGGPATAGPTRGAPVAETYVVRPGDCLWAIAARRLGPSATGTVVDSAWRRIYSQNRTAVGPDPNLIHPGLVLSLPPLADRP